MTQKYVNFITQKKIKITNDYTKYIFDNWKASKAIINREEIYMDRTKHWEPKCCHKNIIPYFIYSYMVVRYILCDSVVKYIYYGPDIN